MKTGNKSARIQRVQQALKAFQAGELIIVRDDEDRENEGDFICSLDYATPENINFMATHGRGLICAAISRETAQRLELGPLAPGHQDAQGTAFTVSVDARFGITTGISSADRSVTAGILGDSKSRPEDLRRPGHLFPLVAKDGGVLERRGHTEAALDFGRLAGCTPGGIICEILNPDGTMARGPELEFLSEQWDMPLISIEDLLVFREVMGDVEIDPGPPARLPTEMGGFTIQVFKTGDPGCPEIVAISKPWNDEGSPVVRLHSECLTGDGLGSVRCDCGSQLKTAQRLVQERGGAVLYLRQEGRGIGLFEKIRAYTLQDGGLDTVDANLALGHPADSRNFGAAVAVLRHLGLTSFSLLTNNPEKIDALTLGEYFIVQPETLVHQEHPESTRYIQTKISRMGHTITMNSTDGAEIHRF